ncbi:ulp1 protease family, C-terminal catalytic domain-containing protein [Tanacetum coccineum]
MIFTKTLIAKPLASLTQKNHKYERAREQEETFQTLKDNLCNAPILSLPDGPEDFVVCRDASNQGSGYVLMQRGKVFDVLYLKRCMERSVVEVGDKVMLEVSSWKDVVHFGKKEMLAPRYKYLADTNLHVHLEEIKVDKTLHFVEEPVEIIYRVVKSLKRIKSQDKIPLRRGYCDNRDLSRLLHKASSVVKSKVPTELPKDNAKDKPFVVMGKVLTELPKNKHKADIHKDKPKPKDKHNVVSEVPVLRSKSKCKLEVKAKASVRVLKSNENVKRKIILSKEDHSKKNVEVKMVKGKKTKRKAELKRKRKGGSDSDSSSVDEEKVRRMLKKLKKIKKEYSDEDSGLKSKKKGIKKEKQLTLAEAAHEKYLSCFSSFHNVSIDKIPSRLGRYMVANFSPTTYRVTFDTGDYVEVTPSKIYDILGIPVGGILLFSLDARPIEHDFVSLWVDPLKDIRVGDITSKICLDVVRRLREDCDISKIDWCGYIHNCLVDSKLPKKRTVQYLDGGNDSDGDDDNDQGNVDDNLNDKEPVGSNPSCGFSKVSLDNFDKQPTGSYKSPKNQVVEKESVDPTIQETIVEEIPAKEYEILSKPESYTQWLERNADLVGEMIDSITDENLYGDLFGQNLVTMEVLNQGPLTPDRMPTSASKASPCPEKRIVKPSSYLLSPYMNKKMKFVPKITRLEFIIGNSLFAMQGDGNGYPRKGQKSKPKRQNRARERKDGEKSKRQSQSQQKSKSQSQP